MSEIDPLFQVHRLNEAGIQKARALAEAFTSLLGEIEGHVGGDPLKRVTLAGRDLAIVRTKLQEACFFAKRAMALNPENQAQNPEERG